MALEGFLLKMERDFVNGILHFMILAQIGRHGPIHGYALMRALSDTLGGVEPFRNGTVYPILKELEREGLIRSRWADGDAGPQRKEYELTASGRTTVKMGSREWARMRSSVDAALQVGPAQDAPDAKTPIVTGGREA